MAYTATNTVLLLVSAALLLQQATARDPTPQVQTENLPKVCIFKPLGYYVLPDQSDPTSYYVCCNGETKVRKTCEHVENIGTYGLLQPSRFDAKTGQCQDFPAPATHGSFRSPNSTIITLQMARMYLSSPAITSWEANAICKAADAPVPAFLVQPMARQAGATSNPSTNEEWRIISNSAGRSSTGVVAINAVLLPKSKEVLVWARIHVNGDMNYERGVIASDGVPEMTAVYDAASGEYTVKSHRVIPFCSGNSHLPDGKILVAGGDNDAGPFLVGSKYKNGYRNGLKAIRFFESPGLRLPWRSYGNWKTLPAKLGTNRWYPTQTLLPDGIRTVITGGVASQTGVDTIHSAEIYDHSKQKIVKFDRLALLKSYGNRVIYPLVYVLPYAPSSRTTALFVFQCNYGAIMHLSRSNDWSTYKDIPKSLWPTSGFCGPMSMGGTLGNPIPGYGPDMADMIQILS